LSTGASKPVKRIALDDITNMFKRRYELRHTAIEIFTKKKSYFFTFDSNQDREDIYSGLLSKLGDKIVSEKSL